MPPVQLCCLMLLFLMPTQQGPWALLILHAAWLPWAPPLPWLHPGWQEQVSLLLGAVRCSRGGTPWWATAKPALLPTRHPQEEHHSIPSCLAKEHVFQYADDRDSHVQWRNFGSVRDEEKIEAMVWVGSEAFQGGYASLCHTHILVHREAIGINTHRSACTHDTHAHSCTKNTCEY